MRDSKRLLRAALGDPKFHGIDTEGEPSPIVDVYSITLSTEAFRGLPDQWTVMIVDTGRFTAGGASDDLVQAVDEQIRACNGDKERGFVPILIVPGSDRVSLEHEFGRHSNVFVANYQDVSSHSRDPVQPRYSPLASAIRRRAPSHEAVAPALWPYKGMEPVEGWRFFGRQKELTQLVQSTQSYLIIGPRRVGKTSLMREAARQLTQRGQPAFYIDVQQVYSVSGVLEKMLAVLEPNEAAAIKRRAAQLGDKPVEQALQRLASRGRNVTLLIDELGNAIESTSAHAHMWSFFGALRSAIHGSSLRIIGSCYQEAYLAQQADMAGPLVNFAQEMRLDVYSSAEVEEFILAPWAFWKPLADPDKAEFLKIVEQEVGHHPLFLQYLGLALFEEMRAKPKDTLLGMLKRVVRKDSGKYFREPVEQVFYNIGWALLQYLFLKRGVEATRANAPHYAAVFDDEWVDRALREAGYTSSLQIRRNILVSLELHGLCRAGDRVNRRRQVFAAPLLYRWIEAHEGAGGSVGEVEKLVSKLRNDIRLEQNKWRLTPEVQEAQ